MVQIQKYFIFITYRNDFYYMEYVHFPICYNLKQEKFLKYKNNTNTLKKLSSVICL